MEKTKATHTASNTHRRPYKKSINGCISCKARKIKCDEQKPICSQCQKRFVDATCCKYNEKLRTRNASNPSQTSSQTFRHLVPRPSTTTEPRMFEARLMHHFTKGTGSTTSFVKAKPIPWTTMFDVDIPQVAFSSNLVLNALYAISALDLFNRDPQDHAMEHASRFYFQKALVAHRKAIQDQVDDSHSVPVLFTAVLLAHYAWLLAHNPLTPLEDVHDAAKVTFSLCKGVGALVKARPSLRVYSAPRAVSIFRPEKAPIVHPRFLQNALDDLDTLMARSNHILEEGHMQHFEMARKELQCMYETIAEGVVPVIIIEQRIFTFPHAVTSRFMALLWSNHPLAMAMWMRNIALLSLFSTSPTWWIQGSKSSKTAVRGVESIRLRMPKEFMWTTQWPLKLVRQEIVLDNANILLEDYGTGRSLPAQVT